MNIDEALKQFLKQIIWRVSPKLFHKLIKHRGQEFSIGIYTGDNPSCLRPAKDTSNPALTINDITDIPAAFIADPFMCKVENRWHMFFEVLSKMDRQGQIGLAISDDGHKWEYNGIVLKESFHLAYPYIFEWNSKYYMIPDSPGNGVRLYEATDFPNKWQYVKKVLDDGRFVDSSIFYFREKWWLFSAYSQKPTDPKSLNLYYANDPVGPWQKHPASPIVETNDRIARPGGRTLIVNGKPIRFAQDGVPKYGTQVRAFEILELSSTSYHEQEIQPSPILSAGQEHWNKDGMHHIDAHSLNDGTWIACVDGWFSC